MRSQIFANLAKYGLITILFGSGAIPSPSQVRTGKVKLVVERVERKRVKELSFALTVKNESTKAVFFEGAPLLLNGPRDNQQLEGLYLEQWQDLKGWRTVVP